LGILIKPQGFIGDNMSALDRLLTELIETCKEDGNDTLLELANQSIEYLDQLRNRIKELEKEAEEHPYHEACPKCFRKRECLEKRVKKLEAEHTEEVSVKLKLREIIAELEARTTWQPIETAPKDGTHFLALRSYMEETIDEVWYHDDVMGNFELGGTNWFYPPDGFPTHWMPLPEPPK
jgi:hypothetical protein